MKYLKKFETEADKNAWLKGSEFITPNVVLTGDVVGYNEKIDFSLLPLYIDAIEDLTIKFSNNYEYSKDNATWTSGTSSTSISASAGERVYFRASGLTATSSAGIGSFTISNGKCNVGGNVMSMAYGAEYKGQIEITLSNQFNSLFKNATLLVDASDLVLPATTLASYCYSSMLRGCTSLVTAPALSATTLASYCYNSMFSGCTSLVTAPALPATTLASYCYKSMFIDCTSLVTAPALPATTLATNCYDTMFSGCTSLNYIKAMFTTEPSSSYTSNWVSGVSSSGTFVKNNSATWNVTGNNGIPNGWTVETATA